MKLIILFLLVFGLYSSTFKARNSVTKEEISKMEIVYVSSDIETIFSISCDYFDYAFKDRGYMEKNIIDKDQLKKFASILNTTKNELQYSVDVRVKIYLTYVSGKKTILCIDQFGHIIKDDKFLGTNKKIISFLNDNCKGFE